MNHDPLKETSQEEAYFYKLNKDLIERKRKEIDSQKASSKASHAHWMKCPKCGNELEEIELSKIKVDKCTQCEGVFFDNGELQILLDSNEPKGFLGLLKDLF